MSKMLKCKVIFDASESYTNCYHTIRKFIWDFGDGFNEETREPKITHYYSFGKYKFKMEAVAWCSAPRTPPNSALFEEEIHIWPKNLGKETIIECSVVIIVKDPEYIDHSHHALFQYMDKEDIEKEKLLA